MFDKDKNELVRKKYNFVRNLYVMKVFSQRHRPPMQSENLSTKELAVLDKESITSVVGFMRKFQSDATFSPPTVGVAFDSDNFNVSVDDSDVPGMFDDLTDINPDELRDAINKKRDAVQSMD